jgi:uncharacterized protein
VDEQDNKREDQWFRENEKVLLESARVAREKRERERAALEAESEREARQQQHFMKCPKCGHDLAEEDLDGVSIDRCSYCEGVFFDAGELEAIFTKRDSERKGFFRRLVKI